METGCGGEDVVLASLGEEEEEEEEEDETRGDEITGHANVGRETRYAGMHAHLVCYTTT